MKVSKRTQPKPVPNTIRLDLTGQVFGGWNVLGFHHRDSQTYWLCECECGERHAVHAGNLRSGASTQCCECSDLGSRAIKHGLSGTLCYSTWIYHKSRLCKRWADSVEDFKAECWDHRDGKYLVPIDATKKMSAENHEWTNNIELPSMGMIVDGEWHSTKEAIEKLGITRERVRQLRNKQNGYCKCGRIPASGLKTCRVCLEIERKYKRRLADLRQKSESAPCQPS